MAKTVGQMNGERVEEQHSGSRTGFQVSHNSEQDQSLALIYVVIKLLEAS